MRRYSVVVLCNQWVGGTVRDAELRVDVRAADEREARAVAIELVKCNPRNGAPVVQSCTPAAG